MKTELQNQIEDLLAEYLEDYIGYFPTVTVAEKICTLAFEYYREDLGR